MLDGITTNFAHACSYVTGVEEQKIEKVVKDIFTKIKNPKNVAIFLGAVVFTVGFITLGKPFLDATILKSFAR